MKINSCPRPYLSVSVFGYFTVIAPPYPSSCVPHHRINIYCACLSNVSLSPRTATQTSLSVWRALVPKVAQPYAPFSFPSLLKYIRYRLLIHICLSDRDEAQQLWLSLSSWWWTDSITHITPSLPPAIPPSLPPSHPHLPSVCLREELLSLFSL